MSADFNFIPSLSLPLLLATAESALNHVYTASAFSKTEPFERLCMSLSTPRRKVLVVRWQFCDLISGASDLRLFEIAQKYGWTLLFNQNLHAKVYLFDDVVVIGSANLTNRGLAGGPPSGNIEYCVKTTDDGNVINWFIELVNSSVTVDDEIYNAIQNDVQLYQSIADNRVPTRKGFSQQVNNIILNKKTSKTLYLHDLPMSSKPGDLLPPSSIDDVKAVHDKNMLGLSSRPNLEQIRKAFEISPGLTWLLSVVGQEMYFGTITEKLHNVLCDEPKPYRKEVKDRLSNLLCWAQTLYPEKVVVDRPRHTQRVRIIELS